MWKDAEKAKEKKKEAKAALKKSTKSKTNGDNMDNGEKEKDEAIPDVSVDDQVDNSVPKFFLVLQGKTGRKVFMSQEKLGIDRVAKVKENPRPKNSVFIYDKRTKTVRLASERNFAISAKMGKQLKTGTAAVFRRILNQ
jgi:hypothetical protein